MEAASDKRGGDKASEMDAIERKESRKTDKKQTSQRKDESAGQVRHGAAEASTSSDRSLSFERLKQNWETVINSGTRNVQRGLQNLTLCGTEGLARLTAQEFHEAEGVDEDAQDDPFAPIVLRHTHSLPMNYSASLFDEEEHMPPSGGMDNMRRSSSTPSTSAFRQRSAGSAFMTHLRTMPILGGPDDRSGSAFTLPMQKTSYTSSDPGIRYSAFDPVWLTGADEAENTAIEVTDLGPTEESSTEASAAKMNAASKARKFLTDRRVMRRRRRRSGRENPARPPSSSSSSNSNDSKARDRNDDETLSTNSSARERGESFASKIASGKAMKQALSGKPPKAAKKFQSVRESSDVDEERSGSQKSSYQQLDSDVDEEYQHYRRVGISVEADSPNSVPSPTYQRFTDDRPSTAENSAVIGADAPTVPRAQISSLGKSPPSRPSLSSGIVLSPQPTLVVGGTTSTSVSWTQNSNNSPSTSRSSLSNTTSGQTTISGTVSSGRTILSTVSETDREVMETNKAGKLRRLEQYVASGSTQRNTEAGERSVQSGSTNSTNTHGYLALAGSPAPREGASLPVDRFFTNTRIPVAYSSSSNSGSSSSASREARVASADVRENPPELPEPAKKNIGDSPVTLSSSSHSGGEDPPKFVSYLERQATTESKGVSTVSSNRTPERTESDDRDSPAQIVPVGYSEVMFEEAEAQGSNLIRPVQTRDPKFSARPPLSPVKGLRTPTTPPPQHARPDSTSPAYQQLSPPNIVDHRIQTDVSKPYVFRSAPPRSVRDSSQQQQSMVLVSPEATRHTGKLESIPDDESMASGAYLYSTEELTGGGGQVTDENLSRHPQTYQEGSIEVEKSGMTTDLPVVSPEIKKSGKIA